MISCHLGLTHSFQIFDVVSCGSKAETLVIVYKLRIYKLFLLLLLRATWWACSNDINVFFMFVIERIVFGINSNLICLIFHGFCRKHNLCLLLVFLANIGGVGPSVNFGSVFAKVSDFDIVCTNLFGKLFRSGNDPVFTIRESRRYPFRRALFFLVKFHGAWDNNLRQIFLNLFLVVIIYIKLIKVVLRIGFKCCILLQFIRMFIQRTVFSRRNLNRHLWHFSLIYGRDLLSNIIDTVFDRLQLQLIVVWTFPLIKILGDLRHIFIRILIIHDSFLK